jgi:hypothetical protein
MKVLMTLTAFGLGTMMGLANASAVDTSGCSQLRESSDSKVTSQGALLTVTAKLSPKASCWNAGSSHVVIDYRWVQSSKAVVPTAGAFWMRVNGAESQQNANLICMPVSNLKAQANTSGESQVECSMRAIEKLSVTGQTRVEIEVAPVLDGNWDTKGFEQNYVFEL